MNKLETIYKCKDNKNFKETEILFESQFESPLEGLIHEKSLQKHLLKKIKKKRHQSQIYPHSFKEAMTHNETI